jgi:hypothetical protein
MAQCLAGSCCERTARSQRGGAGFTVQSVGCCPNYQLQLDVTLDLLILQVCIPVKELGSARHTWEFENTWAQETSHQDRSWLG